MNLLLVAVLEGSPELISGGRRGIKYPWAYMVLGQLVAISVSTALFLVALSLRPRTKSIGRSRLVFLSVPMFAAMWTIYKVPAVVGTRGFMPILMAMHSQLLVSLFTEPKVLPAGEGSDTLPRVLYTLLGIIAAFLHGLNFKALPQDSNSPLEWIVRRVHSHPAQGSITLDVVWVAAILLVWMVSAGSTKAIIAKVAMLGLASLCGWVLHAGVNWSLIASIVPVFLLASAGLASFLLGRTRKNNALKRKALLEKWGMVEETVIPGTDKAPPSYAPRKVFVGFWHPYW